MCRGRGEGEEDFEQLLGKVVKGIESVFRACEVFNAAVLDGAVLEVVIFKFNLQGEDEKGDLLRGGKSRKEVWEERFQAG